MKSNSTTSLKHTNAPPAVKKCACHSNFQDETYGASKRLMNPCKGPISNPVMYRCTVCNIEHN